MAKPSISELLSFTATGLFAAAEREIAEADQLAEQETNEEILAELYDRFSAADDFIAFTEPASIADVVVKLRCLLRPYGPLAGYAIELASVRQCAAFLERLAVLLD